MKTLALVTLVAAVGAASIGCSTAANTTANVKVNGANVNSNTAVVVNSSNTNMGMNSNMNTNMNSNRYSSTMTREEYEKNSAAYSADQAASKIGTGANDRWIWFKAKAALATMNNVRDSTINVDVDNGVITLKGDVASKEEIEKALAAVKGIEDKKGVVNQLKVNANNSLANQTLGTGTTDGDHKGNANTAHK